MTCQGELGEFPQWIGEFPTARRAFTWAENAAGGGENPRGLGVNNGSKSAPRQYRRCSEPLL